MSDMTDADIAEELSQQEKIEKLKAEARAQQLAEIEAEKRKPKKQKRHEAEQRFIGRVIREANGKGDIRDLVKELNVSWRLFYDDRHKVIWRALETMNLHDYKERIKIFEMEAYGDSPLPGDPNYKIEEDRVRGMPGSAAANDYYKKEDEAASKAIYWLERELEAADALRLVGGKVYLREVAEIGEELFEDIKRYKDKLYV